ncbi:Beclin-1 [Phlyctochytrium planicorne]|nr:Beclin-1 [Phlyctochytrium planicorne]
MNTSPFLASFFCSNCSLPIKLEPSLLDNGLLEETLAPLIAETVASAEPDTGSESDKHANGHELKPPLGGTSGRRAGTTKGIPVHDSFVMLTRSQLVAAPTQTHTATSPTSKENGYEHKGSLSHRLKITSKLFDLLSGITNVDHPICQDCADDLTVKMEKKVAELRKEKESYSNYLKTLEIDDGSEESDAIFSDLEALKEKEEASMRVLQELEAEANKLADELKAVESELKDLDDAEISYWQDVNRLQTQLRTYENERDSITFKFDYATLQLEKLKRTNVYNDTFRIWHDGPFGTINGDGLSYL